MLRIGKLGVWHGFGDTACLLSKEDDFSSVSLPSPLQSMENALAKEGKTCPTVAHPLDELQFVDFSLDDSIAGWQAEAGFDRCLVSFDSGHKAAQFGI